MKLKLLSLGLVLGAVTLARADFTPVPIDPTSFNHDVVIEASAPIPINGAVNATMDGGTNKNGNTWYEKGYNTNAPTTGLPAGGSVITNGNYAFQMPPDYHVNNAVLVGRANGALTPVVAPATLTLTTPDFYSGLSFLTDSGNGPVLVGYTIHHDDGFTESGEFQSLDWFNGAANVYNAAGRVNISGGGVQNVGGSPAGALFATNVMVLGTAKVTSIDFFFKGSSASSAAYNQNGRAVIFAVSGEKDFSTFFTNTLAVTGFNYDVVVEADAPQTAGSQPSGYLTNLVTATLDGGLSKANNCWYEKGYYSQFPDTGIPVAGSTFTSAVLPATYTMPPSYAANDAVLVSKDVLNANVKLANPGTFGALSFLCAAANGDTFLPCVVQFADGSSENNTIMVPDWFNRVLPNAYLAFGRVNPNNRTLNNTPDQFVDRFAPGPAARDFRGMGLPVGRLFDAVINVANQSSAVTNISVTFTNTTDSTSNRVAAIFAVSGAAPDKVPPVFGYRGTPTPGQPLNAVRNDRTMLKTWEGTNNVVLSVTNIAGTAPIAYQWKKAPRGGGLQDLQFSINYGSFANVTDGGRISGATSSALVISNALAADSADYIVVASNAGGSVTSLVATVMILTTNQSLLVGKPNGDVINQIANDATPNAESVEHAVDQVLQKWLSSGLQQGGPCCGGVLPWTGPVGFTVTPVSGASIPTSMRFYTANDGTGRDPYDYTLEGSNDGATWTRITGGLLMGTLYLPTGRNGTGSAALDPLNQTAIEVDFPNTVGYKSFRVSITNNVSRWTDALMQIAEIELLGTLVPNPPVFTLQPHSVTVFAGASPEFSAAAAGYPPAKFQWYKNGTAIPNATNATYIFPNAQISDSGSTFHVTAQNIFQTITSASATLTVIAAPTQPYPVAILADGPIGYWRLDEADNGLGNNGVVARDSYGGHDGSYSNVVLAVQGYNPSADLDTAAEFGSLVAANSYVDAIEGIDFSRATNSASGGIFSIEAWAYGADQTVDSAIVTKGYNGILNAGTGTGTEQFVLDVLGSPRKFRFLVRDALGNGHVAQSNILPYSGDILNPIPVWHHLVGVCDQPNGKVYLYVDGLLAGSGDMPAGAGILAQPLPITIGARRSGGATPYDNQWKGRIDDVAVYRSALTPNQVVNHYYGAQFPPIITLQPTNITLPENVTATFYSGAYGAGNVGYQWYQSDGFNPQTLLVGQTSSNLTFTTAAAQNFNNYQVVVTNNYGSVTSVVAQLTVFSGVPSFIADLPSSGSYGLGHIIQLQIVAGGTAPFTYQWMKDGVALADNYRISGAQTNVLVIGYATNIDSGTYQCMVSNGQGTTGSAQDVITVSAGASSSAGFTAAGTGWTMQGTPSAPIMGNNRLELTSSLGSTARSAFLTTPLDVRSFTASFIYAVTVNAGGGADGITFCIQNASAGAGAVGGGGGGLGYSGVTPSVALAFNIYNPNTRGILLLQNGGVTPPFTPIPPIGIGDNANPVAVNLAYGGGVLTASFRDTVTGGTYNTNITVSIASIVGGNTAYFGFTGADGGVSSTQVITDFSMTPPPIRVNVQKVGANMVISWPATTAGFLRHTPSLTNPVWTYSTDQFKLVGSQVQVTVSQLTGDEFYRLDIYP